MLQVHCRETNVLRKSIVKANENKGRHGALFANTRATLFFGTPHRGLVVDDILAMLEDGSAREALVKSIQTGAGNLESELTRFINYSAGARIKIVSFKEMEKTKKLKQVRAARILSLCGIYR